MLGIKTVVLIGQLGRIWSKNRREIKIFQSLTTVAFFLMFLKSQEKQDDYNNFKNNL